MTNKPRPRDGITNGIFSIFTKAPNTIAVSCPYCMTMFEDGLKNEKAGQVRVLDLAEIIAPQIASPQIPR